MLSLKETDFKKMKKQLLLTLMIVGNLSMLTAQDWANLTYYRAENAQLKAPDKNETRVVFMGNSITEGWSKQAPEFFANSSFINRGISGQTTPQMLLRFKQDVIELKPKLVVLLAGTNDIAENTGPSSIAMIVNNITSMIEIAKAHNIEVILCSVLPAFDYPWRPGLKPNEKIPELNAALVDYSTSQNIVYVDYFSVMTDGNNGLIKSYTYDGVHPNKKGYQLMGTLLEKAINKVLE